MQLTPLVERTHAFTKASNTRVAIMATGAGSVRVNSVARSPAAPALICSARSRVLPAAGAATSNVPEYST